MSRRANVARQRNSAPGTFLVVKTIEVLFAPGRWRAARRPPVPPPLPRADSSISYGRRAGGGGGDAGAAGGGAGRRPRTREGAPASGAQGSTGVVAPVSFPPLCPPGRAPL